MAKHSIKGRSLRTVGVAGSVVGVAGGIAGLAGQGLSIHETLIGSHVIGLTSGNLLQDGFVVLAAATAAGMAGRAVKRREINVHDGLVKRAAKGLG